MMRFGNINIRWVVILIICLGLVPLSVSARVVIYSKIISGTITTVKDNAVELDGNGIYYYPAKKRMEMDLKPGQVVTLKYYVDYGDHQKRKYIEYAPGQNTLAPTVPAPPDRAFK